MKKILTERYEAVLNIPPTYCLQSTTSQAANSIITVTFTDVVNSNPLT